MEVALAEADDSPKTGTIVLGPAEKVTAIVLIALFVIFIAVLVWLRNSAQWDRLTYLFAGFEALVFAAAGALFGTSVQRAQTVQAQQTAQKQEARAEANQTDAEHGRALATMIRAKRSGAAGAELEARGARPAPGETAAAGDAGLAELAHAVDEWFPHP